MILLLAFIAMFIYSITGEMSYHNSKLRGEQNAKSTTTKANARTKPAGGMREDYVRAYYVGTEREPNGVWEDANGGRGSYPFRG